MYHLTDHIQCQSICEDLSTCWYATHVAQALRCSCWWYVQRNVERGFHATGSFVHGSTQGEPDASTTGHFEEFVSVFRADDL